MNQGLARLLMAASWLIACGPDAADRAYLAALRGDEDGSTVEERFARFDQAIALEPGRAQYYEARAILHIDGQAWDAAQTDLDTAIRLADRPYLRFLRGLVLCHRGDCTAALPEFELAIAAQPDNAQFYRGRALARVAMGSAESALPDAEWLVEHAPQVASSWYARGVALAALGRHREALLDYGEALARMPELVYPLLDRAASHAALGDSASARADLRAVAEKRRAGAGCAYCLDPFRY